MTNLPLGPMISLNSEDYILARKQAMLDAGIPAATARAWTMEKRAIATTIEPRPDVTPCDIPGEYVITWNDWSKGVCGINENLPGCLWLSSWANPTVPGSIRSILRSKWALDASQAWGADPAGWIEFNNALFLIAGRYCLSFTTAAGLTVDRDFGASRAATDAIVFNNELVVCFGSSYYLQKRDTAGSWSEDDDVTADYFALVEDRLWRANNTNEVSNIGPTDNPFTVGSWSSAITVGDDDVPITDLNGSGDRLVVSKEDGLYMGDSSAIFPNVLPQIAYSRDSKNGKNTLVRGSDIFYPYRDGLIRYDGSTAEEIGLQLSLPNQVQTGDDQPSGTRVTALAAQGKYIWAATEPSYFTRDEPYVKKTADNLSTFTDYTTNSTDNNLATVATFSSLGTAANGDYIIVIADSTFYGVMFNIASPNVNACTATVECKTSGGWSAVNGTTDIIVLDNTSLGGKSLGKTGMILWSNWSPTWASATIDGATGYAVRISFSAALSSTVTVSEIRVIDVAPRAYVYRGRPRQSGDVRQQSIIWEPFCYPDRNIPNVTALGIASLWPWQRGTSLLIANQQSISTFNLGVDPIENAVAYSGGQANMARHDGGMPNVNKQWLDLTFKGRSIDANHTVDFYYRTNEATTWTNLVSNGNASPTRTAFSNVTGYALEWYVGLDSVTNDMWTELNCVEVRFRILPTTKNYYRATIVVSDGQLHYGGGSLPSADVQLAALEALVNSTVTLGDPLGTSKTVTVISVKEEEAFQDHNGYPAMLVSVEMVEV